jgi:cytochrome c-type biogenesis protein CcmH/NrfF
VQDWLNWYIPVVLIAIGIRLNSWYPHRVRARLQQRQQQPSAG